MYVWVSISISIEQKHPLLSEVLVSHIHSQTNFSRQRTSVPSHHTSTIIPEINFQCLANLHDAFLCQNIPTSPAVMPTWRLLVRTDIWIAFSISSPPFLSHFFAISSFELLRDKTADIHISPPTFNSLLPICSRLSSFLPVRSPLFSDPMSIVTKLLASLI